jgi:hypothetical protein
MAGSSECLEAGVAAARRRLQNGRRQTLQIPDGAYIKESELERFVWAVTG